MATEHVTDVAGNRREVTPMTAWWHGRSDMPRDDLFCVHSMLLSEPCQECGVRMQPPVA